MTDYTALLLTLRRPPEDAHSTAGDGNANSPAPSHDDKTAVTRRSASHIVVRAAMSGADQYRILALPYPLEYQAFWRVLADIGVSQEYLMDRMGASP